ncbi:DUF7178 family protein [Streptomyces sp. AN091965]|uniref:DUF7178 family protein n=1 Tax=Streptomyces sp. AN091965 TaxID=2927803 RepID=UPI001F611C76|nr:hypothetical protein [Streptomyces sp. AN091965]MCI3928811.1 hypothetical protein [Streptomyces sp. AN091965]
MIAVNASTEGHERYIGNIITVWRSATEEQLLRGRSWYRTAHEMASLIAGGDVRAGAGVVAALSANTSWPETLRLARRAFETGVPSGHLPDALAKATSIMSGRDPRHVLPLERKTGQFFRCIFDPDDPDAVVIDRHAHDVAVGETYGKRDRGLGSARRYALLARCYREAAVRLGELPSTVQAVTWVVHTDRARSAEVLGHRGQSSRPQRTVPEVVTGDASVLHCAAHRVLVTR